MWAAISPKIRLSGKSPPLPAHTRQQAPRTPSNPGLKRDRHKIGQAKLGRFHALWANGLRNLDRLNLDRAQIGSNWTGQTVENRSWKLDRQNSNQTGSNWTGRIGWAKKRANVTKAAETTPVRIELASPGLPWSGSASPGAARVFGVTAERGLLHGDWGARFALQIRSAIVNLGELSLGGLSRNSFACIHSHVHCYQLRDYLHCQESFSSWGPPQCDPSSLVRGSGQI